MNKMRSLIPVLALFATMAWLAVEQQTARSSYLVFGQTWNGATAPWRSNTNFPAAAGSNAAVLTALQGGADAWHDQACSNFVFNHQGSTTIAVFSNDGTNAVYHTGAAGGGTLAVTVVRFSGATLASFDMRFFGDVSWSVTPSGGQFDIQGIAAHEFGHAAGIDHATCDSTATMNASTGPGANSISRRSLNQVDIDAITFLYGVDPLCGAMPGVPTPNPMSFSSNPQILVGTVGVMTATIATGPAPVEYEFEHSGTHAGGDSSSWQAGATYIDSGLQPNGFYSYRVRARNASFTSFVTAFSPVSGVHLPANVAGAPTITEVTSSGCTIDSIDENGNLPHTLYAVRIDGQFVDATGALQGLETFQNAAAWAGTVVQGLDREVSYNVDVKVRDFLGVDLAYGPAANITTLLLPPCADGTVPDGSGGIQDTLSFNGSFGDINRRVFVTPGTPVTFGMDQPTVFVNPANWIIWGHVGIPDPGEQFVGSGTIGTLCFFPCDALMLPEHFTLASTYGSLGCTLLLPASPAPYSLTIPGFVQTLPPITLQGIVEVSPGVIQTTNAVIWLNQP
ncbi:MAG: matrixin family metalloprotease [Planctomycetota bacterium]